MTKEFEEAEALLKEATSRVKEAAERALEAGERVKDALTQWAKTAQGNLMLEAKARWEETQSLMKEAAEQWEKAKARMDAVIKGSIHPPKS